MKQSTISILSVIGLIFLASSCSDRKKEMISDMALYLPEKFVDAGMQRISEVRTYDKESLWQYVDGGAELYLLYDFVEVATADYKKGEIEVVADIYKFASSDDAFGIYSMFRTPDVRLVDLGIEGFLAPASVNFVKGEFLVRLTGYDESAEDNLALKNLAEEIDKKLPGKSEKPSEFSLFPDENYIPGTEKYYAKSFMGQEFCGHIYSRGYLFDSDTVTLFLTPDESGQKYIRFTDYADRIGGKNKADRSITFDDDYGFTFKDDIYGTIIMGLCHGRLVGMINYSDKYKDFLNDWLNSLNRTI
jgi:hypothetical protein